MTKKLKKVYFRVTSLLGLLDNKLSYMKLYPEMCKMLSGVYRVLINGSEEILRQTPTSLSLLLSMQ